VAFSLRMPGPDSCAKCSQIIQGLISVGNKILFLVFNLSVFSAYYKKAIDFRITLPNILRGILYKIVNIMYEFLSGPLTLYLVYYINHVK
jgi:hypothetical protein